MSSEAPPEPREGIVGGFVRLLEIDARDTARHPDAFDRLRGGDLQGVLVHNVYPPDVLEAVVERLERHDPPFLKTWFPAPFRSWFFGRNLNLAPPVLDDYFHEATEFHRHLAMLFPPSLGVRDYVAGLLSHLDNGRPFRVPPGPVAGEEYMFATVRAHLEGGFIPPHCDNEQALRPSYRHLRTLVEPHMMSYVVALTRSDGGGALEVYDYRFEPSAAVPMNVDRAGARPDVTHLASVSFRLPPGAMIVFDSGRYLHRVSPVEGPRKRWTVSSFLALSRRGDAVFCWG